MICVALAPRDADHARALMDEAAEGGADLVELRLDLFETPGSLEDLIPPRPLPVVVTMRPTREGGRSEMADADRVRVLLRAAELGAEHVDVEHDVGAVEELRKAGTKVIVSRHDFEGMPDLVSQAREIAAQGPDVVKVVGMAKTATDVLPVFRVLNEAALPTVAIAMGEPGLPTRLLAPRYPRSYFTFAAPDSAEGTAPGQVSLREMRQEFRVGATGPATELYGVLGPEARGAAVEFNRALVMRGRDAVAVPFPGAAAPLDLPGLRFDRWMTAARR